MKVEGVWDNSACLLTPNSSARWFWSKSAHSAPYEEETSTDMRRWTDRISFLTWSKHSKPSVTGLIGVYRRDTALYCYFSGEERVWISLADLDYCRRTLICINSSPTVLPLPGLIFPIIPFEVNILTSRALSGKNMKRAISEKATERYKNKMHQKFEFDCVAIANSIFLSSVIYFYWKC